MSKKDKPLIPQAEVIDMAVNNADSLMQVVDDFNSNPELSLEVDPLNRYHLTDAQKLFIKNYVDFKNIAVAANLSGISTNDAKAIFNSYNFKKEVDRLSRARVQRRFLTQPLSLMQMIGYLTSLITEENVNEHEKISSMDKVKVVQILAGLKEAAKKDEAIDADFVDVDGKLKDLSVDTIKQLLASQETSAEKMDKDAAIQVLSEDKDLSPDELAYLRSLDTKELLDVIEQINKMKK